MHSSFEIQKLTNISEQISIQTARMPPKKNMPPSRWPWVWGAHDGVLLLVTLGRSCQGKKKKSRGLIFAHAVTSFSSKTWQVNVSIIWAHLAWREKETCSEENEIKQEICLLIDSFNLSSSPVFSLWDPFHFACRIRTDNWTESLFVLSSDSEARWLVHHCKIWTLLLNYTKQCVPEERTAKKPHARARS